MNEEETALRELQEQDERVLEELDREDREKEQGDA